MKTQFLAIAALAWGLGFAASPAWAQDHEALVADLNAADYETRTAATDALLIDDSLDVEALVRLVPLAETPEQKHRMLRITRHHVLRNIRLERFGDEGPASVGIYYPNGELRSVRPVILISRVLPGFPGAGRLRAMDRLLAINGQPLVGAAQQTQLNEIIRSFGAGQTITVTVERDGENLDVVIPLANAEALGAMYQANPTNANALAEEFKRLWTQARDTHFAGLMADGDPDSVAHPEAPAGDQTEENPAAD